VKNITFIYYLQQAGPVHAVFKRGYDGKKVGVFASPTPNRLSRRAIQDVRLFEVNDILLSVEGLDAIYGSQALDTKMCRTNINQG
jgi:tRNA (Thr-GGU) A37 N-methylase